VGSEAFPQYFALLSAWLLDASGKEPIAEGHPLHGIRANPSGPSHPDVFYLCSSADSARFAGEAGVGMMFAEFIARADGDAAVEAYRQAFRPSALRQEPWAGLALIAYAAETAEQAWREDSLRRAANVSMLSGNRRRFADVEAAEAFLAPFAGTALLGDVEARTIASDAATVRSRLEAKAARSGADELFVMATGPTLDARIRSLTLIKDGNAAAG
jgi:alkanesulfonate monooxygenase SsuD/methylene tetrahydromethanopterin reductase-like flavin-dependent oxidoreductase (luciferase family)